MKSYRIMKNIVIIIILSKPDFAVTNSENR